MRTNPFTDTWLFLIGAQDDQTALGMARWLFVAMFLALLAGSVVIACYRLAEDPPQRTGRNVFLWGARTAVGAMWFQGALWKLPLFSHDNGLYYWTQQMTEHAAFPAYADLVKTLLLPNFSILNLLVLLAELGFAASLMLGIGVRVAGAVGILFVLNLWIGLYRHPQEWPWTYIFLAGMMATFSIEAAGRSLGLDGWLRRRYPPDMTNGPIAAFARYCA